MFITKVIIVWGLLIQLGYFTATAHPDSLSVVRDGTVWSKVGFVAIYALVIAFIVAVVFCDLFI